MLIQAETMPQVLFYADNDYDAKLIEEVEKWTHLHPCFEPFDMTDGSLVLYACADGLSLMKGDSVLKVDFSQMLPRLIPNNLNHELLIKAARFKNAPDTLTAIDATAGLGQDAFLLAASGFNVHLYEKDSIIAMLLYDALLRGKKDLQIAPIIERMHLNIDDSITAMPNLSWSPDVVLLDPMFPQRKKSGLVKKKFQMLHLLEQPCRDETALLDAALSCNPRRIVIKRPGKGDYLAGRQPSYTLNGGTTRYDCIVCR
jgi:16S rRNA (guanine1516-N2)-methyltransferase